MSSVLSKCFHKRKAFNHILQTTHSCISSVFALMLSIMCCNLKLVSFSLLAYLLKLIFEKSILRQMYLSWNFSHWNMDPPWNVEVRRTFLSQRQTPLSMKFILIRQVSTPLLANILDVLTTSYLTQLGMAMLIRNLPQQVFWHCAVHLVPSGQPFLWRTLQNSTLEKTERKKENRWKMCSRVREVSWNGEH